MSGRILATLSLAMFACSSPEAIGSSDPLDCTPNLSIMTPADTLVTTGDSGVPDVLYIGWRLPASCPSASVTSLNFGAAISPDFGGTEFALMNGVRSLTGLRWFDCVNSVCERDLPLEEHFVIQPGQPTAWISAVGSSFHQGPKSTLIPLVRGFTWYNQDGVHTTNFTLPRQGSPIEFDLTK